MARPAFDPSDEQSRILATLRRLAARQAKLTAETDQVIATAHDHGIPIAWIAGALGRQRKTVYRHLGHRMP